MAKYLDKDGLTYFWGKIKSYVASAVKVTDVEVNGTSVVSSGTASVTVPITSAVATGAGAVDLLDVTTSTGATRSLVGVNSNGKINHIRLPEATTSKAGAMSSSDKTKLNGIATGAEVNVQSNWNETDTSSDAYILNKPTIPTKTSDLTNDDGFITGITSSDVTTALGYTPYNSTNPNGYTSNTGTITGITMNGSSKGTSGVVNLGTVITSHQDISGKLDKSGGTMTGQLKTSYCESVAMGSYGSAQTTVDGLVNEVRFSSGVMGSASINTAYTKNGTTIPTGWYNFIFSPHRSGGVNGSASGDNCNYGTLILAPMTFTGDTFIIRCSSSGAASVRRLGFTNKATYDGNGSGVTGFWNSAITTHQDGWLEREGNVVYCYMRFSAPATVTSGQQIATIPVGYRPSHVCHYTATRAWAIQATAPVSISKTSGAVAFINNAFAASANYVLCATWLTEETFPI